MDLGRKKKGGEENGLAYPNQLQDRWLELAAGTPGTWQALGPSHPCFPLLVSSVLTCPQLVALMAEGFPPVDNQWAVSGEVPDEMEGVLRPRLG